MFDLIKRLRFWWTYPRHLPHPASPVFLGTREWKRVRYEALRASDGRCELCGRGKHDGVVLNVDHIVPRVQAPHLALDVRNLQVLCGDGPGGGCNEGKGNRFADDWRRPDHPHSKRRKR
jgi:5-methylcytosine-specific restriction endonuclease McrA